MQCTLPGSRGLQYNGHSVCGGQGRVRFQKSARQFSDDVRASAWRGRNGCHQEVRKRETTTIAPIPMRLPTARSCMCGTALSVMARMEPAMGPTLVGKDVVYKQVLTDPGMFSIIYGGTSGAMQSLHRRGMKQDDMLRIIAYVRTLDK